MDRGTTCTRHIAAGKDQRRLHHKGRLWKPEGMGELPATQRSRSPRRKDYQILGLRREARHSEMMGAPKIVQKGRNRPRGCCFSVSGASSHEPKWYPPSFSLPHSLTPASHPMKLFVPVLQSLFRRHSDPGPDQEGEFPPLSTASPQGTWGDAELG